MQDRYLAVDRDCRASRELCAIDISGIFPLAFPCALASPKARSHASGVNEQTSIRMEGFESMIASTAGAADGLC